MQVVLLTDQLFQLKIVRIKAELIYPENSFRIVYQLGYQFNILANKECNQSANIMTEFWEANFIEKQEMWGFEPAKSAALAKDFFVKQSVKNILIPGIGYGRNAKIFNDNGITVSGIEISKTAIELARKHNGTDMTIYEGSVTGMPFDNKKYDGIFCYALIHLLNQAERQKLIQDCYNQLNENGYMVFTAITKEALNYGKGKLISKDRYEFHKGARIFYYDRESVQIEFGMAGLFEIIVVNENQPMFLIKCSKDGQNTEKYNCI